MCFNFPQDEKKQELIYLFAEPIACLIISILLMVLHPYIGIPLLAATLSFLFNEWYHIVVKPAREKSREDRQQDESDKKNSSGSSQKPFVIE